MKEPTLNELRDKTWEVTNAMPNNGGWTIHNRLAELMEEVGELANAIQTDEGFKSTKRKKSELVDSVCDVLFEVFAIAAHYKIDLNTEYPKVLKFIDDRRKSGEFDH
ncbi:MAG: MazG nucleotide pyrophosphohydrolase domain-containing protein [Candidatus Levybacteria bacterium]|nr:MazG nucleotide pyrophosphohydrolase domain-containing protein [Candidatus Levybacteria bacterium]